MTVGMFVFLVAKTDRGSTTSEPPKSRSNSRRPSLSDEKDILVLQVRHFFFVTFLALVNLILYSCSTLSQF